MRKEESMSKEIVWKFCRRREEVTRKKKNKIEESCSLFELKGSKEKGKKNASYIRRQAKMENFIQQAKKFCITHLVAMKRTKRSGEYAVHYFRFQGKNEFWANALFLAYEKSKTLS